VISLVDDGRGLDAGELAGLRTLVDAFGLERTSDRAKVSSSAITRALAGLPVKRSTVASLRRYLEGEGYGCTPRPIG
jgi:hypothetical protein